MVLFGFRGRHFEIFLNVLGDSVALVFCWMSRAGTLFIYFKNNFHCFSYEFSRAIKSISNA